MRQQKLGAVRGIAVSCLVVGLSACGGRSARAFTEASPETPALDATLGETPEKPTSTAPAAGGSQSATPEPPSPNVPSSQCAGAPTASLQSKLVWQRQSALYGMMHAPFFAFSPGGTELITPAEEYATLGNGVYRVGDGADLERSATWVLGRDAAWTRELRGSSPYAYLEEVSIVDMALEQLLMPLAEVPLAVQLSADGQYVLGLYCQDVPRLERREISTGEVTVLELAAEVSPCSGQYYMDRNALFVVGSSNDSALFPTSSGNELAVASFSTGIATAHTLHAPVTAPAEWPPLDQPLTLALAPNERALATVDGTGTLRVWSYPELVQSLPDMPVGVTRAFHDCYCTPRNFAPVAWSPDARWLATTDEAGSTVVRRACDGSVVATIATPTTPGRVEDYARQGPAFLAFNPNGSGLAVFSISGAFDGTVSYYELVE